MAALFVLLSHVSMLTDGRLGFLASTGVQAVDIFFVLSGFVIAHVSATRERDAGSYFASRAARIYSVAIPALILTIALNYFSGHQNTSTAEVPFQPITSGLLIRCISFINEQWNAHRFPASNGPYWSLGFEVWYYIAFGAFVFAPRRWRWPVTVVTLVFIGPKVALLFPLWLSGVVLYRVCAAPLDIRPLFGWILFVTPLLILAIYQGFPHPPLQPFNDVSISLSRLWTFAQDYFVGVLFCVNLVGFKIVSSSFAWLDRFSQSIRWIAGATFSLYLTHVPIMYFLIKVSPWPSNSLWTVALMLIITIPACFAFAEVFERHKDAYRRAIIGGYQDLRRYAVGA